MSEKKRGTVFNNRSFTEFTDADGTNGTDDKQSDEYKSKLRTHRLLDFNDVSYIDDFEIMLLKREHSRVLNKKVKQLRSNIVKSEVTNNVINNKDIFEIKCVIDGKISVFPVNSNQIALSDIFSLKNISKNISKNDQKQSRENIGIGDVALEETMNLIGEGQASTEQIVSVGSVYPLKRDLVTVQVKCRSSDILKYSVYALYSENVTYSLGVIYKKGMDIPLITYEESNQDPSMIVDTVYIYDVGKIRSLHLKSLKKTVNIPERLQPLLPINDPTDISYTGDINVTIDDIIPELLKLNIIIKNKEYISIAPHEKLLNVSNILISF